MPKVTNEDVMLVEGFAPIDTTGAAQAGNPVSLKNSSHITIIINTGTWAGGTAAVTLQQSTDVAESDGKALAFSFMWTNDGATGAAALTKTAVTSNTFNVDTAASKYVIEVDADTLDADNNFDVISVQTASPGANADLIQAEYILSGTRHLGDTTPLSD